MKQLQKIKSEIQEFRQIEKPYKIGNKQYLNFTKNVNNVTNNHVTNNNQVYNYKNKGFLYLIFLPINIISNFLINKIKHKFYEMYFKFSKEKKYYKHFKEYNNLKKKYNGKNLI